MNLRLQLYRAIMRILERFVLPHVFSSARLREGNVLSVQIQGPIQGGQPAKKRAWFHAASVGELESLWTVIDQWAQNPAHETVITIFSESGTGPVKRLQELLQKQGKAPLYVGYSPWEGQWGEALNTVNPTVFVTAKYESWPELWLSLGATHVPLVVVGAKMRRSLLVAKWICRGLGGALPRMLFLPTIESDAEPLWRGIHDAEVRVCHEPRWDRVQARARDGNLRAHELVERYKGAPRPWGVLGSVWPEDLVLWRRVFDQVAGTLWVVPHRSDSASIEAIEKSLRENGLEPVRTTQNVEVLPKTLPSCVLVDEMGFLSELYAVADWAYIGGGFGQGLHSTIEPAIHGIAIAGGPARSGRFPEVAELRGIGQLTIVKNPVSLALWIESLSSFGQETHARWKELALARLGGTGQVLAAIESMAP